MKKQEPDFIRNIYCDHYDSCLNSAARLDRLFNCDHCQLFEQAKPVIIDQQTMKGCAALLLAVFRNGS